MPIKFFNALLFCSLLAVNAHGQSDDFQTRMQQGIKLYDQGDYAGAVEQYKAVLASDKDSALANYEIALTYLAMKKYEKTIEHCDVILSYVSSFHGGAYLLKGSALDMLGRSKDAIVNFKEGITSQPNNHLLYFNLAVTYAHNKEYDAAEAALQKALIIAPSHASSHLLLSNVMYDQGKRAKSALALYNFLTLEPKGNRAKAAYETLVAMINAGVQPDGKSINITMPSDGTVDDFVALELALSLTATSKHSERIQDKDEYKRLSESAKDFFLICGQLQKEKHGFWWDYYVSYFYAMTNANHVEAFSYYISQAREDVIVASWLNENKDKVDLFLKWSASTKRTK